MSAIPRYLATKTAIQCMLLAMLLGSLSAGAAAGKLSDGVVKRTVGFADLDLTRRAGAAALYARIESAAGQVCAPLDDHRVLASIPHARRCKEQAIASAVADVNAQPVGAGHVGSLYVSADKKKSFCVYDGPSPEAIRRTASRSKLPVGRITEVCVLDPYFYK